MISPLSRAMSVGTAAYAVYALAKPRHLGAAITADPVEQTRYDLVATLFGTRDLAVSSVALFSRSPRAVRAAMVTRVLLDLTDAAVLTPRATSSTARAKVLGATLSWATLNGVAIVRDARRAG
jgi:hypothetical protein